MHIRDYTDLVKKLKQGDKDAADQLIIYHIPLAKHLANRFAKKHYNTYFEFLSIAHEVLVSKIEKIRRNGAILYNDAISPYLNKSISFAFTKFISRERKNLDRQLRFNAQIRSRKLITYNHGLEHLLLEEIYSSSELSPEEKILIQLRIAGHTDQEIGEHFGVSKQRVFVVRKNLRQKLSKHL